jgi:hypothetical protein
MAPPGPEQFEQGGRAQRIAVPLTLALFDANDHPFAIDVAHGERHDLAGAQARALSHRERRLILKTAGGLEEPSHLFEAQDDGSLARFVYRAHLGQGIGTLECGLEEKL